MKVRKTIEIAWWSNGNHDDIPEAYKEALEESGFAHANEMIGQGFREGELHDDIHLGIEGEPEDGLSFSGWWSVKTVAG